MKRIVKGPEPRSLTQHRVKSHADYDNYQEKDELRQSLLSEQGYICCYCMSRITLDKMRIEHWRPQSRYSSLQLDYRNLLGACLGNEGAREENEHCDKRKGENEVTINPADLLKNCEILVKYASTGKIRSDDPNIEFDLNQTLNLNVGFLVKNRKTELQEVINKLNNMFPGKPWPRAYLVKIVNKLNAKDSSGRYSEYCQYVALYLSKRL